MIQSEHDNISCSSKHVFQQSVSSSNYLFSSLDYTTNAVCILYGTSEHAFFQNCGFFKINVTSLFIGLELHIECNVYQEYRSSLSEHIVGDLCFVNQVV